LKKYLALITLSLFLWVPNASAQSQVRCFPYDTLKEAGETEFGYEIAWVGLTTDEGLIVEMWANKERTSWTAIQVLVGNDGTRVACILGAGTKSSFISD
jgi:hypothetical protein